MRKQKIIYSSLIILIFIISFYGRKLVNPYVNLNFTSTFQEVLYFYSWWIFPSLLVVGILFGFKNMLNDLGLNKSILVGVIFSIITVSPMILSYSIIGKIDDNLSFGTLIHKTFVSGFLEEYFFRGFLFGILFRKLKWGFIPAAILGALIFGLGHISQGSTFIEMLGVFAVTAFGAIWFSWLYIEWNNNLWIPIFVHILMNLSWSLFNVSENAMGGIYTNIFRVITIGLTIIITIRYHKKRGLNINRKNLTFRNMPN